jgi:Dyp-type peroxidase family
MTNLEDPLDLEEDPEADTFLEGIQGNIIKGHGRDFTRHLLLKMTGDPPAVRRWIARFAADHVTSAQEQRRQRDAFRAHGGPGKPFAMFLLAPGGYRHLDAQRPAPGGQFIRAVDREYFLRGMKRQLELKDLQPPGRTYNDPPSAQWEAPYRGQIDAMVLLADDDFVRLGESERDVTGQISGAFERLTTERGRAIKKTFPDETAPKVVEHFGFQDGISQPMMIQQDLDDEISKRGNSHWNPKAPLSLALVREPGSEPGSTDRLGSFMVFRKLEQDVTAFREAIASLSTSSGVSPEEVGAMAVGRFENGKPVLPGVTVKVPGADPNDFHYDQDVAGARCPFHAHIRKTNPRGDVPREGLATEAFERAKRVVRRGITYDERRDREAGAELEVPSEGVGLLFMCFQSNLDQFVIQQEGSDGNDFVRDGTGFDAVIGQFHGEDDAPDAPIEQTWPTSTDPVPFKMVNFVRMRGGEYFFAPSMRFLSGLAQA